MTANGSTILVSPPLTFVLSPLYVFIAIHYSIYPMDFSSQSESPAVRSFRTLVFSILLVLGIALFNSCTHLKPAEHTGPGVTMPETYSLYEETSLAPDHWWEEFNSKELDTLIDEALSENLTVKQAYARLGQAEAIAVKAGAPRYPDLELFAGISETRRRITDGQLVDQTVTDSFKNLSLISSYEVDLWGRISSRQKSALLNVEASREDLYTAAVTLTSEVTTRWLAIISVRNQLELLRSQIKINKTTLDLINLRYMKGAATALDVYQQRLALAESLTLIPPMEALEQTLRNELAVLLGQPPQSALILVSDSLPAITTLPAAGIPADLLSQRPDVRAAGLKLRAAEWDVTAARADRLPAIRLTAEAGFSAGTFPLLFENWLARLAGSLAAPIFKGGELNAEVERQSRIAEERLAVYGQTVLTAIREVEDAMVNEQKQVEFLSAQGERLNIARQSHQEALVRYRKGLNDYLPVLSALITVQRLERDIVLARFDRLKFRVQLHRALGGTWMGKELELAREKPDEKH